MAYNESLSSVILKMCYNAHRGDGMEYKVNLNYDDEIYNITVEVPIECSYCGRVLSPRHAATHRIYMDKDGNPFLGSMYQCQSCDNVMMDIQPLEHDNQDEWFTAGHNVQPVLSCLSSKHNEFIVELSPLYVEIYKEAHTAKVNGCSIVAGMGYRNALEHLVKDYAISLEPNDRENILNTPLSKCINDYIDDEMLNAACKSCNWLANDYCHYKQKYSEYSLGDLLGILDAIEMYISCRLTLKNAGLIDKR